MKKNLLKTLLLIPVIFVAGCSENPIIPINPKNYDNTVSSEPYVTQKETVHEGCYDIPLTEKVFYKDNIINYKLVFGNQEDVDNKRIVTFIKNIVFECFKMDIEVVSESEFSYSSDSKYIIFNMNSVLNSQGIQKDSRINKFNKGYQITLKDNSIFVYSCIQEGYRLAAMKLFREMIGFECFRANFYAYDLKGEEVNSNSTVYVPDFKLVEIPDYAVRYLTNGNGFEESFQMGFSINEAISSPKNNDFHNSFDYVDPDIYQKEEVYKKLPEYADLCQKSGVSVGGLNLLKTIYSTNLEPQSWFAYEACQLCYTTHGNKTIYNYLLELITDKMITSIYKEENANFRHITFCQQDDAGWCNCSSCKAVRQKYGCAASTLVLFLNDLSVKLDQKLNLEATKRGEQKKEIIIQTFIYSTSFNAPTFIDDSIILKDNVGLILCPASASYCDSFLDSCNEHSRNQITKWSTICKNMACWLYDINFTSYLMPYNTFACQIENYRFMYDNNCYYFYNNGFWGLNNATHFNHFQTYIDTRSTWDLSVSLQELENKFFKYYYGPAGDVMKTYYNEMCARCDYLRDTGMIKNGEFDENYYNRGEKFWPTGTLKRFADLIDMAYELILPLEKTNPTLYEKLKFNIQIDAVFTHAILTIEKDEFLCEEERIKYRNLVYEEAVETNTIDYSQNHSNIGDTLVNLYFEKWGF